MIILILLVIAVAFPLLVLIADEVTAAFVKSSANYKREQAIIEARQAAKFSAKFNFKG